MTNGEIEAKLKTAIEHAVPDVWDQIAAKCQQADTAAPVLDLSERDRRRRRRPAGRWALAAAALLFLLGGYGHYQNNYVACAAVGLDVNPSLELLVSRSERVIDAKALNADAEAVLAAAETEGRQLADALDEVVAAMMAQGYLREDANAVLVTVEQPDAAKGAILADKIAGAVETSMAQRALDGAVLSQTITQRETLAPEAERYGISVGKMALIGELAGENEQHSPSTLKDLSINELGTLLISPQNQASTIKVQGTPSAAAYIGAEKALDLAQAAAGLADSQAQSVWLDTAQGTLVYQITLTAADAVYHYTLDAYNGEVLAQSRTARQITAAAEPADKADQTQTNSAPQTWKDVGQDYADQYKDVGQDYADQYKDVGQDYVDQYKNVGQDYVDQYKDVGQDYADHYKDVGQDYADHYKDVGQDYADQYKDVGKDYADQYKDVGKDYADHYKHAAQEGSEAVHSADPSSGEGTGGSTVQDGQSGSRTSSETPSYQDIGHHFADEYKETAQHYIDQYTGGRGRASE